MAEHVEARCHEAAEGGRQLRAQGAGLGRCARGFSSGPGSRAGFGEYVLHEQSWLARNFWGNVVGVAFGMVWRFWSFKKWVFLEPEEQATEDAAHEALV